MRERDGDNRDDFAPMLVWLQDNEWHYKGSSGKKKEAPTKTGQSFFDALYEAAQKSPLSKGEIRDGRVVFIATLEEWRKACFQRGLLDADKAHVGRTVFSRAKLELITKGWIACDEMTARIL